MASDQSPPPSELHALHERMAKLETFFGALIKAVEQNIRFQTASTELTNLLQGQVAARLQPRGTPVRDLAAVAFRVSSQWGEDGIIEWLVAHLPGIPERFIEFGVETFYEANCRFLLLNRNWKGLVFDGNEANINLIRAGMMYWRHDITAVPAFITRENIDGLLVEQGFAGPVGILSIDIDGNDYWVWEQVKSVDPAIVICEYNAILGDLHAVTIPYEPAFTRFRSHHSGLYFGASIGALRHLAAQRGYEFVGTNRHGVNAFFVRRDLAGAILPLLETCRAWPSRHRDARDGAGNLSYASGLSRYELIRHLPVIDVTTGREAPLQEFGPAFSEEWLAGMEAR